LPQIHIWITMQKHIHKLCFVLLLSFWTSLYAQEYVDNSLDTKIFTTQHTLILKTQYLSIKDEFNYGLVFQGLNLGIGYTLDKTRDKSMFSYSPDLSFGANFSKGVGLAWHFRPIDVYYGFKVNNDTQDRYSLVPIWLLIITGNSTPNCRAVTCFGGPRLNWVRNYSITSILTTSCSNFHFRHPYLDGPPGLNHQPKHIFIHSNFQTSSIIHIAT